MTKLARPDIADSGAGHQLDLIAARDELIAIAMYADGAAVPLALLRIAATRLQPIIGPTWAQALQDAVASVDRCLTNTREAAQRADSRALAAMQTGEHWLAMHKDLEAQIRDLERTRPTP